MKNPPGKVHSVLVLRNEPCSVGRQALGATLEPGAPVELFNPRIFGGGVDAQQGRQYDVAPDGRFLINMVLDEAAVPITLIQNWRPEGKK